MSRWTLLTEKEITRVVSASVLNWVKPMYNIIGTLGIEERTLKEIDFRASKEPKSLSNLTPYLDWERMFLKILVIVKRE